MSNETRTRRLTLACGVLFLITFITSIPALALLQPVLDDPAGYIAGPGADTRVLLGVALEMILVLANIGTAVVLVPIFRRGGDQVLSVGFLTARIIECTFISAGILFVLGIVTLRHDDPGAASLATSLAAMKDWTFLLGPGFVCPLGNGLILGILMYRSGLVPRRLALVGIAGGPLLTATGLAVLFDIVPAGGVVQSLATAPEFVWELSLGVYLTVTGLRSSVRGRTAPAQGAPLAAA
ncbi:MAG: DUF4386 domain-containing protein [Thermoleophilia bacterium]|nr:DUF4386 domain-containing protein [Thermoleophilia bacterium]